MYVFSVRSQRKISHSAAACRRLSSTLSNYGRVKRPSSPIEDIEARAARLFAEASPDERRDALRRWRRYRDTARARFLVHVLGGSGGMRAPVKVAERREAVQP